MLNHDDIIKHDLIVETDEDYRQDADTFAAFAKNKDHKSIMDLIHKRAHKVSYINAVDYRDKIYDTLREYNKTMDLIKNAQDYDTYNMNYIQLLKEYNLINDALLVLNRKLDLYRALNAEYAEIASTLRDEEAKENGTFISYDADTIGDLKAIGAYESGSEKWHEVRQAGIGGSDVGKIMKVDEKYGAQDYREVRNTKLGLANDEDPSRKTGYSSAIGRGNAWEEALRQMYQDSHPEQKIAFCKTSWEGIGEHHYRHANFDGLILGEDNLPEGILEIKTGTHKSSWGNVDDGIYAVPAGYRTQVLWYAMLGNLSYGVIVALLDDYDYREYHFNMSDPQIQEECKNILEQTDAFWADIEATKLSMIDGTFVEKVIRKGFRRHYDAELLAKPYAAFAGISDDEASIEVKNAFADMVGRVRNEAIQPTMTKLYKSASKKKMTKPFIGIDIETSSDNPKRGYIIELAVVKYDTDGSIETVYNRLFNVPEKVVELGTGRVDVHHITSDMLEGKTVFLDDKEAQKEILELLKSGIMVAHNASYEKSFLSAHLDGFAEAYNNNEIQVLDTRNLVTNIMLDSKDNSLESFAEDNGVEYVNAHRAAKDTEMMIQALKNFRSSLSN